MNGAYVMSNVLFTLIYFKHSYFWTQLKRLSLSLSNLYAENIVEKKLFANASGICGKERTFSTLTTTLFAE